MFSSCLSLNLSYLPALCVSGMKTEAGSDGFERHRRRIHGVHIAVHQILDELFRYLIVHFQVFRTVRVTVKRLNPDALTGVAKT